MITDQRRIAQASKKDANAMKRLTMLGGIFLPGTFISSLFSMVFFDYQESTLSRCLLVLDVSSPLRAHSYPHDPR